MSTIEELLYKRAEVYKEMSDQILRKMQHNVLAATVDRLTQVELLGDGRTLLYDQIFFDPSEEKVMIRARIMFAVGFKKEFEDGEVLEVTKENQDYFQIPFQIVVPLSIAEHGTKEDVLDYFHEKDLEAEKESEEVMTKLRQVLGVDPVVNDEDLIETLTDEQKQRLVIPGGGKLN